MLLVQQGGEIGTLSQLHGLLGIAQKLLAGVNEGGDHTVALGDLSSHCEQLLQQARRFLLLCKQCVVEERVDKSR